MRCLSRRMGGREVRGLGVGSEGVPSRGAGGGGGFRGRGEKGLANSTCGVFVSPAEAPAAEITTWGTGLGVGGEMLLGPLTPAPVPAARLGHRRDAGHHRDRPIPSGARDVPGLGDSPWQGFGTHLGAPAPVWTWRCCRASRVTGLC